MCGGYMCTCMCYACSACMWTMWVHDAEAVAWHRHLLLSLSTLLQWDMVSHWMRKPSFWQGWQTDEFFKSVSARFTGMHLCLLLVFYFCFWRECWGLTLGFSCLQSHLSYPWATSSVRVRHFQWRMKRCGCCSVVEHLPSEWMAFVSITRTIKVK